MHLLALAASLLFLPLVSHASFTDVPEWHVYEYAIDEAQLRGVIRGYSDGTFRPEQQLNRAEFTTMVVRAFYPDFEGAGCEHQYKPGGIAPDVEPSAWYTLAVCFAKNKGIIQGYPDGTFRPEQTINVVEASAIVARAANLEYETETDAWYRGPMISLADKGALPLSMESMVSPVKRFELAAMLYPLMTGDVTARPSFTYEDFIGVGHDTSRYESMRKNIRAAYDQQVQAGTLREYADARFDGCGAVSSYADQPWYANLKAKLDRYPTVFWEPELTSEGCYAVEAKIFVFLGPSDYCSAGGIFRYDIQSGELLQASANFHSDSQCHASMNEFGKREGTVIPITGSFGDAGCSATTYYDYDFVRNHVELKKSFSQCQDEEGQWTYF